MRPEDLDDKITAEDNQSEENDTSEKQSAMNDAPDTQVHSEYRVPDKNADRITLHANTDKNARKSKGHNTDHVGQIQKVYFVVERLKSRSDIHS